MKKGLTNITERISAAGVFLLFGLYPLFVTNGYYNITISKAACFCVIAYAFLVLCVSVRVVSDEDFFKFSRFKKKPENIDAAYIAFTIFAIISCILSRYSSEAFGGREGRYVGLVTVLAFSAVYVLISKYYVLSETPFIVFECVTIIICAVAFIQFRGINFMGLYDGMSIESRVMYLSSIGNLNVFSSYLCVAVPLSVYLFCVSEDKRIRILYLVALLFGYTGLFVSCSDSGYVGFAAGFFICAVLLFNNSEKLRKLILCFIFFFISAFIFYKFSHKTTRMNTIVGKTETALPIICFFVVIYLLLWKFKPSEKILKRLRVVFVSIFILIGIAVFAAVIYFTLFDKEKDLGVLETYLRFNDQWGTERGYVWSRLIRIFGNFSLKDKLFGYGEDTVSILMHANFENEMLEQGYFTDTAHNGFLQILLTHGILGLISYIAIIVFSVRNYILKKDSNEIYRGMIVPVSAFLAQDIVNITQPITTPYLFIFLALLNCTVLP